MEFIFQKWVHQNLPPGLKTRGCNGCDTQVRPVQAGGWLVPPSWCGLRSTHRLLTQEFSPVSPPRCLRFAIVVSSLRLRPWKMVSRCSNMRREVLTQNICMCYHVRRMIFSNSDDICKLLLTPILYQALYTLLSVFYFTSHTQVPMWQVLCLCLFTAVHVGLARARGHTTLSGFKPRPASSRFPLLFFFMA